VRSGAQANRARYATTHYGVEDLAPVGLAIKANGSRPERKTLKIPKIRGSDVRVKFGPGGVSASPWVVSRNVKTFSRFAGENPRTPAGCAELKARSPISLTLQHEKTSTPHFANGTI
jgi:hypothetical protein